LLPSPQAEEIPARKKPRVEEPLPQPLPRAEEPLPTTTDEAARKTASPDISEGLPSPATHPPSTAAVNVSTRRRSQIQLPLIETSETQPDDTVDANAPPDATVDALACRRSSRRVIPTSRTGTPVLPPTATMEASSRRQSRHQTSSRESK
jgi:hypothetical protein